MRKLCCKNPCITWFRCWPCGTLLWVRFPLRGRWLNNFLTYQYFKIRHKKSVCLPAVNSVIQRNAHTITVCARGQTPNFLCMNNFIDTANIGQIIEVCNFFAEKIKKIKVWRSTTPYIIYVLKIILLHLVVRQIAQTVWGRWTDFWWFEQRLALGMWL